MNLRAKRRYQMLARVSMFGAAYAEQFPAPTVGGHLFATVENCVRKAADHAAAERAGRGQARNAMVSTLTARRALRKRLEAIQRTARVLAIDTPGVDKPFRLPRGIGDARLLRVGRSFARHARPHVRPFIAHGLPSTFLTDLVSDIDGFDQVLRDRAASRAARIAANASLKASIEAGLLAVRRLDAVVPNVLGDNPAAIAAWRTARRVARTVRRPRREAGPEIATGDRALAGR